MKAPAFLFALPIALVAACNGDDAGVTPDAGNDNGDVDGDLPDVDGEPLGCTVDDWDAPDFEDNAEVALALRTQLAALKGRMEADEGNENSDRDVLVGLYEDGDVSLADTITEAYDEIVQKTFNDFVVLVTHANPALTDEQGNWTGGGSTGSSDREGGVVNGRGLDGAGNEPVQLVEKGLFGAVHYQYALGLTEDDITPATIDALAALWGTDAELDAENRTASAKYSFDMGFHGDIADALTDARSYAADGDCDAELDDAVERFFRLWEQALLARAVFYVNAGSTKIADAQDDDELANALHELSEGLGLAFGLYGVEDPASGPLSGNGRLITDDDIEAMMGHLGFDNSDNDTLSVSTTAEIFVDNENDARATAQSEFEDVVKDVYDLDDSDIEGYHDPTAG